MHPYTLALTPVNVNPHTGEALLFGDSVVGVPNTHTKKFGNSLINRVGYLGVEPGSIDVFGMAS